MVTRESVYVPVGIVPKQSKNNTDQELLVEYCAMSSIFCE